MQLLVFRLEFPRALAFDVLPRIGEPEPGGGTGGEARLAAALRRLLAAPTPASAGAQKGVPAVVPLR